MYVFITRNSGKLSRETRKNIVLLAKIMNQRKSLRNLECQKSAFQKFSQNFKTQEIFWINPNYGHFRKLQDRIFQKLIKTTKKLTETRLIDMADECDLFNFVSLDNTKCILPEDGLKWFILMKKMVLIKKNIWRWSKWHEQWGADTRDQITFSNDTKWRCWLISGNLLRRPRGNQNDSCYTTETNGVLEIRVWCQKAA